MLGLLIAVVVVLISIAVYQRTRKPRSPKRETEKDMPPKEHGSGAKEENVKAQKRANEAGKVDRPREEAGLQETPMAETTRNGERSEFSENPTGAVVDRPRAELPSQGSPGESVCERDESQRVFEEAPELDPQTNQPKPAVVIHAPQPGVEDPQKTKGASVEPAQRGGRPRTPGHDSGKQSAYHKTCQARPEIVCWKEGWQWIPAIELPEGFPAGPAPAVVQSGQPLTRDECRKQCWRLCQLSGEVHVTACEQQSGSVTIPLSEEFLLFKLSRRGKGRLVKFASWSSYLVIVPKGWTRDENLSGPAPVVPEPVCVRGYQAHFFNRDKAALPNKIAFRTPEGKLAEIPSSAPAFELVGKQLSVTNQAMVPLFGCAPPTIRALDQNAWSNVETIVVGEEGGGSGRWRMTFEPSRELIEQQLPPEVANRKGGWYFLRFYDTAWNLLDSIDFRFLSALKDVRVLEPTPAIPCNGRHRRVRVELLHELGWQVMPVDSSSGRVHMERREDRTVLLIPPDPAFDETRWAISTGDGLKEEFTFLCERIWWSLGEEDGEPVNWTDKPIPIRREYFVASSNEVICVRLPRPRWTERVHIGFKEPGARAFPLKATERTLRIPLRDFGDTQEVSNSSQEYALRIWIEREDEPVITGVIAKIPARAAPIRRLKSLAGPQALCKGGTVFVADCRDCRKRAAQSKSDL